MHLQSSEGSSRRAYPFFMRCIMSDRHLDTSFLHQKARDPSATCTHRVPLIWGWDGEASPGMASKELPVELAQAEAIRRRDYSKADGAVRTAFDGAGAVKSRRIIAIAPPRLRNCVRLCWPASACTCIRPLEPIACTLLRYLCTRLLSAHCWLLDGSALVVPHHDVCIACSGSYCSLIRTYTWCCTHLVPRVMWGE